MRFRMLFGALLSSAVVAGCSDVKESPLGPCEERMPTADAIEIEVARGSIAFVDMLDGASANGCGTLEVVANSWSDGEKGEVRRSEDNPNELAYLSDREAIGDDAFSFVITNGYNELEVPVNVRIYQRLKLTGTFPHGWVESPDITVEGEDIGGTGEVTANGVYEVNLRLFSLEGDTVNLLSIEGQRHGNPFSLHSMLPSTERLYELRAGDDRVSESAWPALRVNSITTAYAMLLHGASGDVLTFTDAQLAQYGRAVDSNRLADVSAWLYLVADEADYNLPEGYQTSWLLAADRDALDAELEQARSADDLSRAIQSIVLNSSFMPEPSTEQIQGRFTEVGSQVPWWPKSESRSWDIGPTILSWRNGDLDVASSGYTRNGAAISVSDAEAPFSRLEILVADENQLVLWHPTGAFRLERDSFSRNSSLTFDVGRSWVLPALPKSERAFSNIELLYTFSNGTFTTSHVAELSDEYLTSGSYTLNSTATELTLSGVNGERFVIERASDDGVEGVLVENSANGALLVASGFSISEVAATPLAQSDDIFAVDTVRPITNWHQTTLRYEYEDYFTLTDPSSSVVLREAGRTHTLDVSVVDKDGVSDVYTMRFTNGSGREIHWKVLGDSTDTTVRVLEWGYTQNEDAAPELSSPPRVNTYCKDIEACTSAWW